MLIIDGPHPIRLCVHVCPLYPVYIFRQQLFEFDETLAKKDDDVFHFVAYLPINGRLYELDGLQEGPLDHGKCDINDWVKSVRPVLQKRMNRYTSTSTVISNHLSRAVTSLLISERVF